MMNNLENLASTNIQSFLAKIQSLVACRLSEILNTNPAPCKRLQQALEYTALSDGKRLRPALIYALADNMIQDKSLLIDTACAVELIHTYSIVHDDLPAMDNDDVRRGKPSCHIEFDEATAILVGDSLQSLAFNILSDISDPYTYSLDILQKKFKIIQIISQAIGTTGMVAGQSLELSRLACDNIDLKSLNQIHHLKTGKLFAACLQIAATLTDSTPSQYSIATQLGETLGLAFQIQDDILDCLQNSQILGKPAFSDAKRNLQTYANLVGQNQATEILNNLWQTSYSLIEELKLPSLTLKNLVQYIQNRLY